MAEIRRDIRFLLNGEERRLPAVSATDTLLDYIRLDASLTGTKEGCAEGDCGACTVLIGHLQDGELYYQTVNSCIRLLATVDRCHVVTVEHLSGTGSLHAVQQAMVDQHGSQCGFCTPGIVMSLYALWLTNPSPDAAAVNRALQGNLCRCTGYRPIVAAALAAGGHRLLEDDPIWQAKSAVAARLHALADAGRVEVAAGESRTMLPADEADLVACLAAHPTATLVAGATDVGLWVTKFMRDIAPMIYIGHLDELRRIELDARNLCIGAGVSYSDAEAIIVEQFPFLATYWSRIGGWQVRNMGTIGGNIANGSPIGDTPPVLIALGAGVTLNGPEGQRTLALEDYFIDYGKQDRQPGEYVQSISIPRPGKNTVSAAYKISKRPDEDISALCAGFHLTMDGDTVAAAQLAFGGMAATPKRARKAEAAITGKSLNAQSVAMAQAALREDFNPISDMRASADYRMRVAQNLLTRFYHEHQASAADRRPA